MFCELAGGQKIFYSVQGNEQGAPILFINGLSQSTLAWKALGEQLKENYRLYTFDLIFQGQSDKTGDPRSISQHADDVIALLDHLNLDKVNLAGISFGSVVTQNLLVRYPHRIEKATLISTFGEKTARFVELDHTWRNAYKKGGFALMVDTIYLISLGPKFFENPPLPIPELKQMTINVNDGEAIQKLMFGLMDEEDYQAQLAGVNVPCMVVHGEYDFLCLPDMGKSVANAIPNARWELIEGVGHTLNVEAAPRLADLLKDFL